MDAKWYEKITLPDLCIQIRMECDGSSECWTKEEIIAVRNYLRGRLDSWKPSKSLVDEIIRLLIMATLDEIGKVGWI